MSSINSFGKDLNVFTTRLMTLLEKIDTMTLCSDMRIHDNRKRQEIERRDQSIDQIQS